MPTKPLLSEFARDAVSMASGLVTVVGFWIAIWQIRRTRTAALAAKRAVEESRRGFQSYALTNAMRFLTEAKLHRESRSWDKVAMRLGDLSDQVAQLTDRDDEWGLLLAEARYWEAFLRDGGGDRRDFSPSKWTGFVMRMQNKIDSTHGPFREAGRR